MPWCHCIVSRFFVFSPSAAKKEVVQERSGSLHVEFACCLWNLYLFPQSKAMLVRITGYSKLAVNVNVNTNCCMLVYSSPAMDLQTVHGRALQSWTGQEENNGCIESFTQPPSSAYPYQNKHLWDSPQQDHFSKALPKNTGTKVRTPLTLRVQRCFGCTR